jgi:hypothetical protein
MKADTTNKLGAEILATETKTHFQSVNLAKKKTPFYLKDLFNLVSIFFFVLLVRRLDVKSFFSTDALLIMFGFGIFAFMQFYIFRTERRMDAVVNLLQEHKLFDFPPTKTGGLENL